MFLIISKLDDLYGVLDTSDEITEYYTESQIKDFIRDNIEIGGVELINNNIKIYCHSDSVIKDFLNDTLSSLARFGLLNMKDRNKQLEKIYEIAFKYGLCEGKRDMSIDIDKNAVIFHELNTVVPYKTDGSYDLYSSLDICDDNVISLSSLGISAFYYITMKVGTKTYDLRHLLSYLSTICKGFKYEYISYIGITPSNKMFKIITLYRGVPVCFSVKFDTFSNLKKQADKIIGYKSDTVYEFTHYINKLLRDNPSDNTLVVTKISEKPSRGSERGIYDHLKKKYSTLKDIYMGFQY